MKIITTISKGESYEILVDDEDYSLISRHKWYLMKSSDRLYAYASFYVGSGKDKLIQMTQMIMGNHGYIDHKDNNSLNNQKSNLRPATRTENEWNKGKQKTSRGKPCTSQYKGVAKYGNRWDAKIKRNGVMYKLGAFDTELEAALAYNTKAIELSGSFAWVNPIPEMSDRSMVQE